MFLRCICFCVSYLIEFFSYRRNIRERERQEEELHKALLKFPVIQSAQPFGWILKIPKEPAAPDVHPFTAL
jgi:hypothetical protein